MSAISKPFVERIAYTNMQLLRQLRENGYSDADQHAVWDAYFVGCELFANAYRACGSPFMNHLVGTASILTELRQPRDTIVAGLLHAAYQEGDFAGVPPGLTERKRRWLLPRIGEAAERIIVDYTVGSRNLAGLRASYARFDEMREDERTVLTIQLANELEDYRDLATNYARNADRRLGKIRETVDIQAEMARRLGFPEFATALEQTYREALDFGIATDYQSAFANAYSVVPQSCRLTKRARLLRLAGRVRRKLGLQR